MFRARIELASVAHKTTELPLFYQNHFLRTVFTLLHSISESFLYHFSPKNIYYTYAIDINRLGIFFIYDCYKKIIKRIKVIYMIHNT